MRNADLRTVVAFSIRNPQSAIGTATRDEEDEEERPIKFRGFVKIALVQKVAARGISEPANVSTLKYPNPSIFILLLFTHSE
jgi:hypothetical protein